MQNHTFAYKIMTVHSKSQFVTDYAINSIPRFLLIDPDGNIVSADAPRPSDPKLIELFNELNI